MRHDYLVHDSSQEKPIFRCAKSEQTVYVGDVNDNAPIMSREHISMNLREDTPIGQTLLRVRAADADSTYGILTYSLEQNDEGIFRVDPQNGEIFLARPIDYETKNKYEVYFLVKFSNAVKSILFSDGRDGF